MAQWPQSLGLSIWTFLVAAQIHGLICRVT